MLTFRNLVIIVANGVGVGGWGGSVRLPKRLQN
jgi:hypothetical protein